MSPRQVAVLVPAAVEDLDEPHVALGQPPGQQAVGGKRAGLARIRPVKLETLSGSPERSISSGTEVCIR